ncbi:glycerophosphodiester phosphodiesterase [Pseudobacter ginsenosidimutans]|uniref:Glycerophosphoryl diester phosphodiesterase n=1 Tax=Pseudobacter ginsenosidimutans TaxID=661488 RepID=A0A4Q7MB58_9BACT|nr:glycerophosphodiester phosphodiesterase family protein [Pseudobacter ginsenosidimutans]QEC42561.1 hypothetical protein FSB84_12975 [Pseudobacter ginsenosidimutans]RZS63952.1 glycerophosphoryl diester phosphodiesterase [Pseudobacter ginsenosidimutans]
MIAKLKLTAIFSATALLLSCSKGGDNKTENPDPGTNPPTTYVPDNRVVAHRGAFKEFSLPENSIASLEKAMELSCYASECDLAMTKDKQVVIWHDEKINGQYVKDINYADIQSTTLSNNEKIPTLAAYLDKVVANKKIILWMDVKSLSDAAGGNEWSSQTAEAAAALVRSKQAQKYVCFIVGRKAVLDRSLTAAKGEWPSGYMNVDYTPAQFQSAGYTWANFDYSKFYTNSTSQNTSLIADYKAKQIKLSVYTVDDEDAMNWFAANKNIDAISTNYPFKLLQKVRK